MLDALLLRGMALRTQESYIDAVGRLARHYRRSRDTLSAEQWAPSPPPGSRFPLGAQDTALARAPG